MRAHQASDGRLLSEKVCVRADRRAGGRKGRREHCAAGKRKVVSHGYGVMESGDSPGHESKVDC